MESMMKGIQPWGPSEKAAWGLAGTFWWIEACSLARSSFPGMGRERSWNVSTVVETCR